MTRHCEGPPFLRRFRPKLQRKQGKYNVLLVSKLLAFKLEGTVNNHAKTSTELCE